MDTGAKLVWTKIGVQRKNMDRNSKHVWVIRLEKTDKKSTTISKNAEKARIYYDQKRKSTKLKQTIQFE